MKGHTYHVPVNSGQWFVLQSKRADIIGQLQRSQFLQWYGKMEDHITLAHTPWSLLYPTQRGASTAPHAYIMITSYSWILLAQLLYVHMKTFRPCPVFNTMTIFTRVSYGGRVGEVGFSPPPHPCLCSHVDIKFDITT